MIQMNIFHSLMHPFEAAKKLKGQADFGKGFTNILIYGTIGSAITIFMSLPLQIALGYISGTELNLIDKATISFVSLIVLVIYNILAWLIGGTFIWAILRVLGGRASLGEHLGAVSYPMSAALILNGLIGWIPIVSLFGFIFSLWFLCATVVILKEIHEVDWARAIMAAVVVPIILAIVLAVIAVIGLYYLIGIMAVPTAPISGVPGELIVNLAKLAAP
jgi:hypothetical protein